MILLTFSYGLFPTRSLNSPFATAHPVVFEVMMMSQAGKKGLDFALGYTIRAHVPSGCRSIRKDAGMAKGSCNSSALQVNGCWLHDPGSGQHWPMEGSIARLDTECTETQHNVENQLQENLQRVVVFRAAPNSSFRPPLSQGNF
ncbi:hypothetical protein KIL84_015695 [Mauremys mutica]|uniref:Uncharacterized protein n=1 Tax=Mauremys mutica TaxID=74926 RepID=A0A9D3WSG5_9SAUR|nr:hypothetical protein KIL84_015695 [Mauremys mutica]